MGKYMAFEILLGELKNQYPGGLRQFETTYQHDYERRLGENRDATFQYDSTRSLSPNVSLKGASSRSSTPSSI